MAESKKPFHETVAEKLIEQLKAGTAPWQKPWVPGQPNAFLPVNATTGKRYKGINAIHLMAQDHLDPRWMTYKQAAGIDAQVRKGEKGTTVQHWKFSEEHDKVDDHGRPVLDAQGKPVKETIVLERPRVFFATVFNAEQIDGLPPIERKPPTWDAVERAEHILGASGATIRHGEANRAFYRLSTDSIHLPDRGQFPTADRYYATALHELGHWTGHASRLDRDLSHPFGSEGYAKEELRAEIASMILGDELGIGHDPEQHAAYVASWIKALEEDPLEIFRAAAAAEKIHDYVLAFEQTLDQVQNQDQDQPLVQPHTADQRPPHEMTLAEFAEQATVEALTHHGRKWNVALGDRFAAFSDADSPLAAIVDVHRAAVNNALYLNAPEAAGIGIKPTLPPPTVLAYYPDLVAQHPHVQEQEATMQTPSRSPAVFPGGRVADQKSLRTYIDVPFKAKDEAKQLGARWDRQLQSWYVPSGVDKSPFAKWAQKERVTALPAETRGGTPERVQKNARERVYLAVPYGERAAAKAAGALWDKAAKSWYAGSNADRTRLERWQPENGAGQQGPAMSPREEFAEALKSVGCLVSGEHPEMDGKTHRINVEGDKTGEQAGFYVGHLDGHPAGYIKNNRTGVDMKWKSKGYVLDPEAKARLQAEAATRLTERSAEQERLNEACAQRVVRQAEALMPVSEPTAYLRAKGIAPHLGALTDKDGQKTYLPAIDADGKQWTMQYIREDGAKRFAKDSRKEGCFHPVGGMGALVATPALVIAEGYATAATLAEALGQATVAAFDSGNLPHVARSLHAKFPDKPVIIAGDDDRHLEITQGINPGRVKAEEAARVAAGKAIFPIFAPGENVYPANLDPITPQSYREHERAAARLGAAQKEPEKVQLTAQESTELKRALLCGDQLAALGAMKAHTDFNDVATRSELGRAGVDRQVKAAVSQALQTREQKPERALKFVKEQKPERKQEQRRSRARMVG